MKNELLKMCQKIIKGIGLNNWKRAREL